MAKGYVFCARWSERVAAVGRPWKSETVQVVGWREFVSMLDDVAKLQVVHVSGLLRYVVLKRLNRPAGEMTALAVPPQTDWVLAARGFAEGVLGPPWRRHSERTWQFAMALAARDGKCVDAESLYVASLLHDTGLVSGPRVACFAVRSAANVWSTAREAGADAGRAKEVADAVCSHISIKPANQLGEYLQAGSQLDAIGTRVWHLNRSFVDRVCENQSRADFPAELRACWAEECDEFPYGRAAFARCPGAFIAATYLAPLSH